MHQLCPRPPPTFGHSLPLGRHDGSPDDTDVEMYWPFLQVPLESEVLGLVFRQGMGPVLVGIAVGIAGALAGTRLLRSLIFDFSPTDPATFAVTTVLLAAVGAAACLVPAWRATRVDPMVVLRDE